MKDSFFETMTTTGDRDTAIARTVRAERKPLFDFIRKRIRNEADAEDILQDVFYQLTASYSVTEPIEKLAAWLTNDAGAQRQMRRVLIAFQATINPVASPERLLVTQRLHRIKF